MTGSRAADVLVACLEAEKPGATHLDALALDVPSMIVLPIDATIDVAISDELSEEK